MNQAKAKARVEKPVQRSYNVLENGDVEVTEIDETTITFDGREFRTWYMDHEKAVEAVEHTLSDKFREQQEKKLEENKALVEAMKEPLEKAEKLFAEAQKKEEVNGRIKLMKKELSEAKGQPRPMVSSAYAELPDWAKEEFTPEEKQLIAKSMVNLKKMQRRKKKKEQ